MSWITSVPAATAFEGLLGQRPQLLDHYRLFYRTFWEDGLAPRNLLELCRLRIAAVHECNQEWAIRDIKVQLTDAQLTDLQRGDFSRFDPSEQAALVVADQISYQHHQITDEQVKTVENAIGSPGAVALLTAIAFFDVTCRLKMTLDVEGQPSVLEQPPLLDGAIV